MVIQRDNPETYIANVEKEYGMYRSPQNQLYAVSPSTETRYQNLQGTVSSIDNNSLLLVLGLATIVAIVAIVALSKKR